MASRTIRVEFLSETSANEIASPPEVHDVSVADGVVGAPRILENPHVDYPGTWTLVDDAVDADPDLSGTAARPADPLGPTAVATDVGSDGRTYRYAKVAEVAGTSGTVAR